jgi:hypothetical protein
MIQLRALWPLAVAFVVVLGVGGTLVGLIENRWVAEQREANRAIGGGKPILSSGNSIARSPRPLPWPRCCARASESITLTHSPPT